MRTIVRVVVAVSAVAAGGAGHSLPAQGRDHAPEAGEKFFGKLKQITFGGQNAEAYFSASGRQLILQRTESDTTCDQQYVVNIDGTGLRRVSNGLGRTTCGYFYADDQRVLYASTFEHSTRCPPLPDMSRGYVWALYDFDIYTSKADGSDLQRLTHSPGYDAEATLSPDGKRMVFTSVRDGDLELYSMNVDGTDLRRITNRPGYDGGAFYSRDGKMLVWRAGYPETPEAVAQYQGLLRQNMVRPSQMEIWVANADGSNARQVTKLGGANFAPYFTPDGKRILFASNHTNPRGRNFDLYLVNLDGTGLTAVTTHGDFDSFPMFSPDGRKLVFASNRHGAVQGETNIFIVDWMEP